MGELRYRTRIGIIMDNVILEWLKEKHEQTDIPQSRIIEKALLEVYGEEINEFKKQRQKK